MLQLLLVAAACTVAMATAALAAPAARTQAACHAGVRQVSWPSAAPMCPRPLPTTVVARPRHAVLHT